MGVKNMHISGTARKKVLFVLMTIGILIASLILPSLVPLLITSLDENDSTVENDSDWFPYETLGKNVDHITRRGTRAGGYDLNFSTYFGGSNWEHARDIFADNQGNVYVVGGTASSDFPTTPGAYDRTFNTSGTNIGPAGYCDAFVVKLNPDGSLNWSTYLGGGNYDRAYAVEVDDQGYVYVAGRAGPGFPVTPGAFQTTFKGTTPGGGFYGSQNAFVAKLSPDGANLIWASYVGIGELSRDMDIDDSGNIYLPLVYNALGGEGTLPSTWFTNAYQKTRNGGEEAGAIKISNDGSQVLWATWLGGSADDSTAVSLRIDSTENVYLGLTTFSADIPTTSGAYDRTYNGNGDFYVAKLTSDGSNLVFGTYIGGPSAPEWINTHNLALDNQGNAYVTPTATSDFPTTPGAFQTTFGGGNVDFGVAKFDGTNGSLIASTFIGGNGNDNPDGIYVDVFGNVYITGGTDSTNFPITGDAYQFNNNGGTDGVVVILSADFSQLDYSTYIGGGSNDEARNGYLGQDGTLYLAGQSSGSGWPTKNAYQSSFGGGTHDNIIAVFSPPRSPGPNSIYLHQGWNLISVPLIQGDQELTKVLESIDGYYDAVQWYDCTEKGDPWKHNKVGKSFGNDLFELNETKGFWIHITPPGDTIFLYNGTQPMMNQTIILLPGWNMVGYPSLTSHNRTEGLNNLTFGTHVDAIWTYNGATQKWKEIGPPDYFELGRGYWVHAKTKCEWEVPL
jgi:hypothetical protein